MTKIIKEGLPKCKTDNILYYIAVLFMPSILLFDLYNRNRVENHIVFTHVLILAAVFAVVGSLLFLGFKFFSESLEGALVLSVIFWILFWLFEEMYGFFTRFFSTLTPIGFMALLGAGLVVLTFIFLIFSPSFVTLRPVFNILAICLAVMFLINFIPAVSHELFIQRERAEIVFDEEGIEPFQLKRTFFIDPSLPSPDILWLHADGMMNLETVEWFWGESQEHLREEFVKRGFVIYPDAQLYAAGTFSALIALKSPMFYDSFWGDVLNRHNTELRNPRIGNLRDSLASVGIDHRADLVPYYELLVALTARGYEIDVTGGGREMPNSFWHLSDTYSDVASPWYRFLANAGDLPELLNLTTPFNIPPATEYVAIGDRQSDDNYESFAYFHWKSLMYTHMTYAWRHDPYIESRDTTAVHVYPLAFEYMAQQLLELIDVAIEKNPNTVIVVQADHGFHMRSTQHHILDQGYSLEQVLELIHSVFSAVRIPAEYGGLDAPIAPLNISRELVNRFVGENYTLLP